MVSSSVGASLYMAYTAQLPVTSASGSTATSPSLEAKPQPVKILPSTAGAWMPSAYWENLTLSLA